MNSPFRGSMAGAASASTILLLGALGGKGPARSVDRRTPELIGPARGVIPGCGKFSWRILSRLVKINDAPVGRVIVASEEKVRSRRAGIGGVSPEGLRVGPADASRCGGSRFSPSEGRDQIRGQSLPLHAVGLDFYHLANPSAPGHQARRAAFGQDDPTGQPYSSELLHANKHDGTDAVWQSRRGGVAGGVA